MRNQKPRVNSPIFAANNTVGYFPAPLKPAGRTGRRAFYGEKVHLQECFDYPHLFEAVSCQVYGKTESIHTGKRGAPLIYSDAAIQVLLMLKAVFSLPYRSVEGLACSLMRLMGLELPVPDHTQMSRRANQLPVVL